MSDQFYREQAARRARKLWLTGGVILVFACAGFGLFNLFNDSCTRSFDRDPEQVVRSYMAAISQGDEARARECWQHDPYYDPESGCSETCLANQYNKPLTLTEATVGEIRQAEGGKLNLPVKVAAACGQSGEQNEGEIVLETIGQNVPWKHWQIITSSVGGTLVDPWCK